MKLLIGKVLKPRGLKGELKVQILTNLVDVFDGLGSVYLDKQKFVVKNSSVQNGFAYLKLDGIDTLEQGEEFRGCEVLVNKSQVKLEADEVLEDELLMFEIFNEGGKKLGNLVSIESFGERVVMHAEKFSFPNEDEFVVETNMTERKIIVREKMLVSEEVR